MTSSSGCAADGSFLRSFLTESANMNPDERGRFLEEPPEGAPDIDKAHEVTSPPRQYCQTGQHSFNPCAPAMTDKLTYSAAVYHAWAASGYRAPPT